MRADPDFFTNADQHKLRSDKVPPIVREYAGDAAAELVWRNDLGGLTFRFDDRFMKWNPRSTGIDLERERVRLKWISERHPAPRVLAAGDDEEAQWIVIAALPGELAVGDIWRGRRSEAIRAIATGLRAIHSLQLDDFPPEWTSQTWVGRAPTLLGPRPPIDPVVVHGDACAPNTLISIEGEWTGNVDFGEGHQEELFDAYGIACDEQRMSYYRALWEAEP